MTVVDSMRRRFNSQLASYTVDDEYPVTPLASGTSTPSPYIANPPDIYDMDEAVPLYESSQLLHQQQMNELRRPAPAVNTATTSRTPSNESVGEQSDASSSRRGFSPRRIDPKKSLKRLGLKFLNARQHFLLACCRDLSLVPPLIALVLSWRRVFFEDPAPLTGDLLHSITTARVSEHFLTGVWCVVSGYLSFSMLDGLMIRWIVNYSTTAAIVRMLLMSTMIVTTELYLASTFSAEGYKYGLHIWILISCCLTFLYIIQNFVTSNLDLKGKPRERFFDLYNIVVFAVVPVGLASFITMIGLLRSLLILRLDIDSQPGL